MREGKNNTDIYIRLGLTCLLSSGIPNNERGRLCHCVMSFFICLINFGIKQLCGDRCNINQKVNFQLYMFSSAIVSCCWCEMHSEKNTY